MERGKGGDLKGKELSEEIEEGVRGEFLEREEAFFHDGGDAQASGHAGNVELGVGNAGFRD